MVSWKFEILPKWNLKRCVYKIYTYNIYIYVFICFWNIFQNLYVYFLIYIYILRVRVAIRMWKLIDPATWSNDRPPNVLNWIVYYIQYFPLTGTRKYKKLISDMLWINSSYPTTSESTIGATTFSSRQVWQRAPSLLDENSTAVAVSPQCAYALASLSLLKEMIFVGDFHGVLLAISMGWRCIYIYSKAYSIKAKLVVFLFDNVINLIYYDTSMYRLFHSKPS